MTKQTDVAKTRILYERAKREADAVRAAIKAIQDAATPLARAEIRALAQLRAALEANGQCGICEMPKATCEGHIGRATDEPEKS